MLDYSHFFSLISEALVIFRAAGVREAAEIFHFGKKKSSDERQMP
jgi:hypothetical protein